MLVRSLTGRIYMLARERLGHLRVALESSAQYKWVSGEEGVKLPCLHPHSVPLIGCRLAEVHRCRSSPEHIAIIVRDKLLTGESPKHCSRTI